jgi:hypothetical protein
LSSLEQQDQQHRPTSIVLGSDGDDDSDMEGASDHQASDREARAVAEESVALSPRGEQTYAPAPAPSVVDDGDVPIRRLQPVDATPDRASSNAALDGGQAATSTQDAGLALFGVDGAEARLAKWSLDGSSSFRAHAVGKCSTWLRITCCLKH